MLIERKEVRIADDCAQTLLKIPALTNATQQISGEQCHSSCAGEGRDANLDMVGKINYGRRLINTEIYPCVKRWCVALDTIREIRIGKMPNQRERAQKTHDRLR